jgi:thiol:disulfide interchange protein DsbA
MKRREFAGTAAGAALAALIHLPARAQNAPAAAPFKAGADYLEVNPPVPVEVKPPQIEVIEFFSYACSHCLAFEPQFEKWKQAVPKDVSVRLEHVAFSSAFEPLQRIFYALQAMDQESALHAKIYAAMQTQRLRLDQPQVLFPWIAQQGVDRAKFESTYNSFGVSTQLRHAVELQNAFNVQGTPAMTVGGRYYTDGDVARSSGRMLAIVDWLIGRERERISKGNS